MGFAMSLLAKLKRVVQRYFCHHYWVPVLGFALMLDADMVVVECVHCGSKKVSI